MIKKKIMLTVLLLAAVGLIGCGKSEETIQKQLALKQEGMQLQGAGDYEGAIQKYDKALELADMRIGAEELDIAYYKASAQFADGDIQSAIDTYCAVLALKGSEEAYLGRGILYTAAGDREKAEADLNKALKKTDDPILKGLIYSTLADTAAAKQCFEDARKSGIAEASLYLANLYEKEGDSPNAQLLYEEYAESGKAQAEGYLAVARSRFEAGNYTEALSLCEKGIAAGESGVLRNLMQEEIACYEKMTDYETARAKAEAYLEKYPEDELILREYEFLKSR
ncbi:MAG: tetratricopeptide repeat protein [Lachnospiraceae bacterium]